MTCYYTHHDRKKKHKTDIMCAGEETKTQKASEAKWNKQTQAVNWYCNDPAPSIFDNLKGSSIHVLFIHFGKTAAKTNPVLSFHWDAFLKTLPFFYILVFWRSWRVAQQC